MTGDLLVTLSWTHTMTIKTGAGDTEIRQNYTSQQRKQRRVDNTVLMLIEFYIIDHLLNCLFIVKY